MLFNDEFLSVPNIESTTGMADGAPLQVIDLCLATVCGIHLRNGRGVALCEVLKVLPLVGRLIESLATYRNVNNAIGIVILIKSVRAAGRRSCSLRRYFLQSCAIPKSKIMDNSHIATNC